MRMSAIAARAFLPVLLLLMNLSVPLAAQNGAVISGQVSDESGEPLSGVKLNLVGCECMDCDDPEACKCCPDEYTTSTAGTFRFANLKPGRYEIRAELEGFADVLVTVDVSQGETESVDITMRVAVIIVT